MSKLTDDAGEKSGNVPRPRSDFENDYAYNGLRTSSVLFSHFSPLSMDFSACHLDPTIPVRSWSNELIAAALLETPCAGLGSSQVNSPAAYSLSATDCPSSLKITVSASNRSTTTQPGCSRIWRRGPSQTSSIAGLLLFLLLPFSFLSNHCRPHKGDQHQSKSTSTKRRYQSFKHVCRCGRRHGHRYNCCWQNLCRKRIEPCRKNVDHNSALFIYQRWQQWYHQYQVHLHHSTHSLQSHPIPLSPSHAATSSSTASIPASGQSASTTNGNSVLPILLFRCPYNQHRPGDCFACATIAHLMAQPCPSSEVVKSFGDVLTLSEPSFGQAEGQSRDPKVDSCQALTQTCSVQQPGQTRSSSVGSPWQMVRSEAASPPISTPNLTASYSLSQTSTTTSQACPFGQFPWSNVYHPASNAFPDVNRPFCISPTRIPGIRCLSSRLATLGSYPSGIRNPSSPSTRVSGSWFSPSVRLFTPFGQGAASSTITGVHRAGSSFCRHLSSQERLHLQNRREGHSPGSDNLILSAWPRLVSDMHSSPRSDASAFRLICCVSTAAANRLTPITGTSFTGICPPPVVSLGNTKSDLLPRRLIPAQAEVVAMPEYWGKMDRYQI
ncbi:unnamed protein product [Protopolystoma xenopodis]|uniref:Uncharacterized protein n=1 Tax=Protopolystoma xenopodis TaxID=117903 RepID=A0A3S5FBN5_9PLAT|nr:unnamed protein product [Protopolystoma xenopodis]